MTRRTVPAKKKAYVKPDLETEKIFEAHSFSCGKCTSGPTGGFVCTRLKKTS